MSKLKLAFRWLGAIVLAFIVYLVVFGAGAVIWQQFGTNARDTIQWSVGLGTALAMISGAHVVPREQRFIAAVTILVLALLLPLGALVQNVLSSDLRVTNVIQLIGTLFGGFIGGYATRIGMRTGRINRVAGVDEVSV